MIQKITLKGNVEVQKITDSDWGNGWMSKPAQDIARIFVGFVLSEDEARLFLFRLAMAGKPGQTIYEPTVIKLYGEMFEGYSTGE